MPAAAGIRRTLDAQFERALAAGPPTPAQERAYTVQWLATWAIACGLIALGRVLRRT